MNIKAPKCHFILLSEKGEIQVLLYSPPRRFESDVANLSQIPNKIIKRFLQTDEFDFESRKTHPKMDATPIIVQ